MEDTEEGRHIWGKFCKDKSPSLVLTSGLFEFFSLFHLHFSFNNSYIIRLHISLLC